MKKYIGKFCVILFVCSFCCVFMNNVVQASEKQSVSTKAVIVVEKYSVTDEKIIPGQEFSLKLQLKNNSKSASGNVLVDITNPPEVIPEYGSVTQTMIDNIPANGECEITFNYKAVLEINTDSLDFGVALNAKTANYVNVRIPVGTEDPFVILSKSIPEVADVGEKIVTTVSFQTIGKDNVNNVEFLVKNKDEIIGSSSIGTISAGSTKTQGVTLNFAEAGTYDLEFSLTYADNDGNMSEMKIGSSSLKVGETSNDTKAETGYDGNNGKDLSGGDFAIILISGVIIILIVYAIIMTIKRYNR